jgi:hypothetical protein
MLTLWAHTYFKFTKFMFSHAFIMIFLWYVHSTLLYGSLQYYGGGGPVPRSALLRMCRWRVDCPGDLDMNSSLMADPLDEIPHI